MNAFFEISGLNIYLQIIVTIVSISIHFIRTRNKVPKFIRQRSGIKAQAFSVKF